MVVRSGEGRASDKKGASGEMRKETYWVIKYDMVASLSWRARGW